MMRASTFDSLNRLAATPSVRPWEILDGRQASYLAAVKAWADTQRQGQAALARIEAWVQSDRSGPLDLSRLSLTSLPPLHPELRKLNVADNDLKTLPEHWPPLSELDVSGNELKHLPEALPVSSLQTLKATRNCLFDVPSCLQWLRPGSAIHLDGNKQLPEFDPPVGCFYDVELFVAIAIGNHSKLKQIIREFPGASNAINARGGSALVLAMVLRKEQAAAILIADPSLDVNLADKLGRTPLGIACSQGYCELGLLLLKRPDVDPCKADANGMTPLVLAQYHGYEVLVDALLSKPDVDPYQRSPGSKSAVFGIIHDNQLSMFRRLLACPWFDIERPLSEGIHPVAQIALLGRIDMLELVLAKLAVNQHAQQRIMAIALFSACKQGQFQVADLLLRKYRCNPDASVRDDKATALCVASESGDVDLIKLLLKFGANPDLGMASGRTPLMYAAQHGKLQAIVQLLADLNCDVNQGDAKGVSAIEFASHAGHADIVKALLAHPKMDFKRLGAGPSSALAAAAGAGHLECVTLLLSTLKAHQVLHTADQYAIMSVALNSGRTKLVSELMQAFAIKPDHAFADGMPLISLSCAIGQVSVVTWLLKNCANPNRVDPDGEFPLQHAASSKEPTAPTLILALLQAGADLTLVSGQKQQLEVLRAIGGQMLNALTVEPSKNHGLNDPYSPTYEASLKAALANGMADLVADEVGRLPAEQQATLLAGLLLQSVADYDLDLASHPLLAKLTRLTHIPDSAEKAKMAKLILDKVRRWDGQGFDGSGRGSFSVLRTDRGRLPNATREILNGWDKLAGQSGTKGS